MARKYDEDALAAELLKFNAFLEHEAEQRDRERALKRAAKKREEAAAELKALREDPDASKEARDAAEEVWKLAVEEEKRVQSGGAPGEEPATAARPDIDTEPATGSG